MLTMYGYMKCGTCRKALTWLDGRELEVTFIDITEKPPSRKMLKAIMATGDYSLRELFNTSGGEYRKRNIKDRMATMTKAEAVELLADDGMLCKRPIVTDGERYTVGFKVDRFKEVWG